MITDMLVGGICYRSPHNLGLLIPLCKLKFVRTSRLFPAIFVSFGRKRTKTSNFGIDNLLAGKITTKNINREFFSF